MKKLNQRIYFILISFLIISCTYEDYDLTQEVGVVQECSFVTGSVENCLALSDERLFYAASARSMGYCHVKVRDAVDYLHICQYESHNINKMSCADYTLYRTFTKRSETVTELRTLLAEGLCGINVSAANVEKRNSLKKNFPKEINDDSRNNIKENSPLNLKKGSSSKVREV